MFDSLYSVVEGLWTSKQTDEAFCGSWTKSQCSQERRTAASSTECTSTMRARAAWTGGTAPSLRSLRRTISSHSTTVNAPSLSYMMPMGGSGEPESILHLGSWCKSWLSQKGEGERERGRGRGRERERGGERGGCSLTFSPLSHFFPVRPGIASVFQGRGVAASATTLGSSQLKADTHRTLSRTTSTQPTGVHGSPGVKKSSVCLQTKFQVVCACSCLCVLSLPVSYSYTCIIHL